MATKLLKTLIYLQRIAEYKYYHSLGQPIVVSIPGAS